MTLFKSLNIRRLPILIILIAGLLIVFTQPVIANDLPIPPDNDYIAGDVTADFVGWCPSNATICRANRQWTADEVQQNLGTLRWKVWQEDNQLIFAYRGRAEIVFIAGGISTNLTPVPNSEYWTLTLQIANLDRAIVSYLFGLRQNGNVLFITDSYDVWRGTHAPEPPPIAPSTQIFTTAIYSPELDELRQVSVYLPPNYSGRDVPVVYMADGQWLGAFAGVIEPLVVNGVIPPTMIVGVHAPPVERARDRRAEEYLLGINDDVYNAHERFFTRTVRRWAELQFGASQNPDKRAIIGFSNGATFAGNTGIRKPNLYKNVMMFSASQAPLVTLRTQVEPRYYLLAGTLEPPIFTTTYQFHFSLLLLNAQARFTQRVAGHDAVMWQEEFVSALRWMFLPSE